MNRAPYQREDLAGLGVRVPPHSLHDYSPTGVSVVAACIEIQIDKLRVALLAERASNEISAKIGRRERIGSARANESGVSCAPVPAPSTISQIERGLAEMRRKMERVA